MSDYQQDFRKISGAILLALFVGYFVGITFFPHKHIVNGVTIVHSHPFSANEQHSHGANMLQVLQQISQFLTKTLLSGIFIVAFLKLYQVITSYYLKTTFVANYKISNFLRPPPFGF